MYSAPLRTAVRALPVAEENTSPYDRDRDFGDWIDADRDAATPAMRSSPARAAG